MLAFVLTNEEYYQEFLKTEKENKLKNVSTIDDINLELDDYLYEFDEKCFILVTKIRKKCNAYFII